MLYHKDVFAPEEFFKTPKQLEVRYSCHALAAAKNDRYGDLSCHLRPKINLKKAEIVEVEVEGLQPVKWVARMHVTKDLDLVMVITPDGDVKTVWGNSTTDQHKTLDASKYVQPNHNLH